MFSACSRSSSNFSFIEAFHRQFTVIMMKFHWRHTCQRQNINYHESYQIFYILKLFGDWFTIEMILHYEGNHKALRPDVCVTLYLNSTQQSSQYNSIDFSIRNHNKTHVFQEFNYALKINGSKRGLWIDSKCEFLTIVCLPKTL